MIFLQKLFSSAVFFGSIAVNIRVIHNSQINYISSTHNFFKHDGNIILIHMRWLFLSKKGIEEVKTSKNYLIF